MNNLNQLGYDSYFQDQNQNEPHLTGRISTLANGIYKVLSTEGEYPCQVSGRFYHRANDTRDFPCVGDWVLFERMPGEDKGIIHEVLERKSLLSRRAPGKKQEEQLMAANIDIIFLVNALNQDFNVRRMERYLMQVYESGASPVFILTKKDLCDDVEEKIKAVKDIAFGVPIHAVDALHREGIDALRTYMQTGRTISLIGSSGVGKSTLMNQLIGEGVQKTQDIRSGDDKGRHTTTHRELFLVPDGGVIIDTPGMRELQLWSRDDAVDQTFQDVEALASQCKFRNCAHEQEPGCAIKQAIKNGDLTEERYKSYLKLQREIKFLDLKEKYGSNRAARIQVKEIHKGTW
nr:ribosome small subunit-dependent GTPase A [Pontibacillus sp. HMF3514]